MQGVTTMKLTRVAHIVALMTCISTPGLAGAAASLQDGRGVGAGRGAVAPAFVSPEVLSDRRAAFRIFAPRADEVRLMGTDIPRNSQGIPMTKADNGVWEVT